MRRRAHGWSLCLLSALAGACVADDAELDIPCNSDDTCPSQYWCELTLSTCFPETSESGPPILVLDGVRENDSVGWSDEVAATAEVSASFLFQITNLGRGEAAYPVLEFVAEECLELRNYSADNLIGILYAGKSFDDYVSIEPSADCLGTFEVQLTMTAERRTFTATFELQVTTP